MGEQWYVYACIMSGQVLTETRHNKLFIQCLCESTGFMISGVCRSSFSISLSSISIVVCSVSLIAISEFGEDEEKPGITV